jgi:adenylate cyclase
VALKDFFETIDDQVSAVLDSSFEIEITDTKFVPNFDDPNITYDNLDTKKKKCKRLESCVLYVDIRNSVQLSASKKPHTLAKVYSTFVRSMIECAHYYGGHVRNIIGDRVMVVFDQADCFKKAIDTAVLMNSVCKYILNKRIKSTNFKCGIGIDYGKMLITKGGAIKQGAEKEFYRSLVWLGKPANIASRLTDLAYKTEYSTIPAVQQGNYYPNINDWHWQSKPYDEFINELESTHSRMLKHQNEYFYTFFKTTMSRSKSYSPILITKTVYDGLKRDHPDVDYIKNGNFRKEDIQVKDFTGDVYGADVNFTAVKDI